MPRLLPRACVMALLTAVVALAQPTSSSSQTRVFQTGVSGGTAAMTQASVIFASGGDGSVTEATHLTIGDGRALIGFPMILGSSPDHLPPGANVTSATLEVFVESTPGAAPGRTLTLLPLFDISGEGPWHEPATPVNAGSDVGVSWNSRDARPGVNAPWLIPGGDAAVVPVPYSDTATIGQPTGQWISFDVTAIAGLIAAGWSNLGWALDSNQPGDDVRLASDEALDPTRRPRLTITWSGISLGFNRVPAAPDLALTTTTGAAVHIQLPFTDADGQPVTHVVRAGPAHGTLEGSLWWSYRPEPGFVGVDTVTYFAHDGFASSPIGTISIFVNGDPSATSTSHANGAPGSPGYARSAAFPVTMDPGAQTSDVGPELTVARDAHVSVIDFPDLIGSSGGIPANATIVNARLELTVTHVSGTDERSVSAWRVINPGGIGTWHMPATGGQDTGVSWLWRDARTSVQRAWLVPGGERAQGSSAATTVTPDDLGAVIGFDVTAAVAAWASGDSNQGWILDTTSTDAVRFASTLHPNTSARPRLLVTWRAQGTSGSDLSPHADAGADRPAIAGEVVVIDGSASSDAEGPLTQTLWLQSGGPSVAIPGGGTQLTWDFIAPTVTADTTFTFTLGVRDSAGQIDFDEVSILVRGTSSPANAPPVVRINNSSPTANEGRYYGLNAVASFDPEGAPVTGSWTQVSGPPVLETLGTPTVPAVFVRLPFTTAANSPMTLAFRVTISDGTHTRFGWKTVDVLDAPNTPPTVSISSETTVESGEWVGLSGTAFDPDPFAFATNSWAQVQGTPVALQRDDSLVPYFKAPTVAAPQDLVIEFSSWDGEHTATTSTTITVMPPVPEFTGGAQSLTPYGPSLTPREAQHLLRRLGYSGDQSLVATVIAQGLPATIAAMMNPIATPTLDAQASALVPTPLPGDTYPQANTEQISEWWLTYKIEAPWQNQLREKISYFYHDLYATGVSVADDRERHWRMAHINLFRNDPFPNYRQLLIDITQDNLMLDWLDNHRNQASSPNENYAREFWELFTLGPIDPFTGLPNYTETDIQEASRAFTGWERYDPQSNPSNSYYSRFNQSLHDAGMKTILGFTGPWKDEEVVDITLTFPQAAEFIAMNLFRFFAHDNPTHATVQSLAQTLTSNGWELAPLVAQILQSEAMFSPEARKTRVKTPTEFLVGFMRQTGLQLDIQDVHNRLSELGHVMGQPPNVKGWNDNEAWLGEAAMAYRAQAINQIIEARTFQAGFDFTPLLPPSGHRNGPATISHLLEVLDIALESDAMFHRLVEYVDTHGVSSTPSFLAFDGNDPNDVDRKLRGLLFMLAFGCPDYHLN